MDEQSFLIESYLAPGALDDPRRAGRLSAAAAASEVRHVISVLVPDEEMCLDLFRAGAADAVRSAALRAGLEFEHVTRCELRGGEVR